MTPPEAAAGRFAAACILGVGLGIMYAFFGPPRRNHPHLTDGAFLPALVAAWVYLGFGICGGDLRLGYTAGLFLGAVLGALSLGKILQPIFCLFWKIIGTPWRLTKKFLKKTKKFAKKVLASGEKWGTIKWNMCRHRKSAAGGTAHEAAGQTIQPGSAGLQAQ